jgi:hypothetical protein
MIGGSSPPAFDAGFDEQAPATNTSAKIVAIKRINRLMVSSLSRTMVSNVWCHRGLIIVANPEQGSGDIVVSRKNAAVAGVAAYLVEQFSQNVTLLAPQPPHQTTAACRFHGQRALTRSSTTRGSGFKSR